MEARWHDSWVEALATAQPSAARAETSLLTKLPTVVWPLHRQGFRQLGNVWCSDGIRETGAFEIIADRLPAATQIFRQEGLSDRYERPVVLGAAKSWPSSG